MLPPLNGHTQGYVGDLARIESILTTVQRQITSGIRVGVASDDPAAVPLIFKTQSEIAQNQQLTFNLVQVKAELDSGDSALQQAIKLMDQAVSIGAQAASSSPGIQYNQLLEQAQSIQELVVSIASTSVNGRHIFSGDLDSQALYTLDTTQPNGVRLVAPANSTTTITDAAGNQLWRPRTATDIFDSNSAGSNVFAAIGQLLSALRIQDRVAAQGAVAVLKTASDHLNQQLGIYGIGEARVAEATNSASASILAQQQTLGNIRDTDVAAAALQLTQGTLQQQAAMQVGTRLSQHSLFDYLA